MSNFFIFFILIIPLNKLLENKSLFNNLTDEELRVFRDEPQKFFIAQKE